ncbi:hypothetical protein BGX20_005306 [Mortierella sp. AD010]|nr:hypothetical protein BGX20_005306 [Mortierella sp. AD010]
MTWKTLFVLATIAASAFAEEFSNCTRPAGGFHNVTEINADGSFCTMLPPYGVNNVAINEACANSYCFDGKYTNSSTHLVGPSDFILSSHYVANTTNSYVQITGCIDSSKWGLSPTDEGGQMDSHGWKYTCSGYKKFLSLLEPATNTFCIRCCNGDNVDSDCNTSNWRSPNCHHRTATATVPGVATTTAAAGSSTTAAAANPSSSTGSGSKGTSAGSRFSVSLESVAVAAVAVMAVAAF